MFKCHPTTSFPRTRRAFTLVEILAVVVIIGIASAIIIPQIGTRDDMRNTAAVRIIVADLIYAANLNQYTIGFDEIGSPYVWNYTTNTRDDLVDGSNIVIKTGQFSTTISIAAATGEITVQ